MFPVRLIKTSKLSSTTTQQHGISISPGSGGRGEERELNCDFFNPYESGYLRAEPSSHNCFAMSFALRIYCQTQFVTARRSESVCECVWRQSAINRICASAARTELKRFHCHKCRTNAAQHMQLKPSNNNKPKLRCSARPR